MIDDLAEVDISNWTLFPLTEERKPAIKWGDLPAGYQNVDGAGVGVATGSRSGVFVLDCDDPSAPLPGDVPDTFAVATRRGVHLYFRVPDGVRVPSTTKFPCPGWDIRGDGGFAVLAADGYEVVDSSPPAEAPTWLLQRIGEYAAARGRKRTGVLPPTQVDPTTALGRRMLLQGERDAKELPVGDAGERDLALFLAANHLVRVRGLSPDVAAELLERHYRPRVATEAQASTVSVERIAYKCQQAFDEGEGDFCPLTDDDIREAVARGRMGRAIAEEMPVAPEALSVSEMVQAPDLRKAKGISELISLFAQHPDWQGVLRYNEFASRHEVVNPPVMMPSTSNTITDAGAISARVWLEAIPRGILASTEAVFSVLTAVSYTNRYHPLQDYLLALERPTDPEGVIQDFCVEGLGIVDEFEINLIRTFMIGAVSRAIVPGTKFDGTLVLHAEQNEGKSRLLYALSPAVEWVQEDLRDLESKDAMEDLRGRWLVEIAEFQAAMAKDPAIVKSFLTRQNDSYRRAYERGTDRFPRQCVFIATTNAAQFLRDSTGDRRYWVVHPEAINHAWVERNRDRIWGAALAMFEAGQNTWLTRDQLEELANRQERHKTSRAIAMRDEGGEEDSDVWTELLARAPEGDEGSLGEIYLKWIKGGVATINEVIAQSALAALSRQECLRMGACLRAAGWKKSRKGKRGSGKWLERKRTWRKGP